MIIISEYTQEIVNFQFTTKFSRNEKIVYNSNKFKPTNKQIEVFNDLRQKQYRDICLYGGGRSGKSMLICIFIVQRAIIAPYSHHIIFRNTAISARNSIFNDTLLTKIANFQQFKSAFNSASIDRTRMIITFKNGSTIQVFGMNHIDKVLGIECSTLYFNECSEIEYNKINVPISRLAEKAKTIIGGKNLKNMIFYDYNPTYKAHWTYKYFIEKREPSSGVPIKRDIYVKLLNPIDNQQNISPDYISSMIERGFGDRFVKGVFQDEVKGAVFSQESIIKANDHYMSGWPLENLRNIMSQVIIGVDPAVETNKENDNTGIIVAGTNGEDYFVLEDKSGKYKEEAVCGIILNLYKKWKANCVIVEVNQGGSWIPGGISMYCKNNNLPQIPIKTVRAVFNKKTRAEPVAVAYANGKVKHIQDFNCEGRVVEHKLMALEDELTSYTGEKNEKSPDRMDAMVYAITYMLEEKPKINRSYTILKGFYGD